LEANDQQSNDDEDGYFTAKKSTLLLFIASELYCIRFFASYFMRFVHYQYYSASTAPVIQYNTIQ
jgi:hypothetical protein